MANGAEAGAGGGGVKGRPVRMFAGQPRAANGLSDEAVYCGEANAVHVAVFVGGASPSATITVEGSDERGGNYLQLPDSNARHAAVAASFTFEVNVGTQYARIRIADRTGGTYTIVVTPYVSAGSRARPQFYDRNPSTQHQSFESSANPHASETRWTYTVPAGRKAMIAGAACRVLRNSAPSATGLASAYLQLTINSVTYTFLDANIIDGAVGARDVQTMAQGPVLNAGDQVLGGTGDGSTAGQCLYLVSAMITEFDA